MQGRKRGGRTVMICLIAAGALVIALLLAGTLLRMQSGGTGFGEAFVSFASDTFNPGSYAPERDA